MHCRILRLVNVEKERYLFLSFKKDLLFIETKNMKQNTRTLSSKTTFFGFKEKQ